VQLPPTGSEVPQLFTWVKLAVATIFTMFRGAVPLFNSVIF